MRVRCRAIDLSELRRLPAIPSGFETERVYRLLVGREGGQLVWRLREEKLQRPHRKQYDSGNVDEWLSSYADSADLREFAFILAECGGQVAGLLTWRRLAWNETVWLIDIRTCLRYRRSGVGTALVEQLREYAIRERARGILVETQTTNYPAICFYQKNGFELAGFNDHLYSNRDLQEQDVALFLFWEAPGGAAQDY